MSREDMTDLQIEIMEAPCEHAPCVDCGAACWACVERAVLEHFAKPPDIETLGAIAKGILGDHATVKMIDLDPLPGWKDLDGHTHPPTPVLRVDVLIDDKSFGMEGPATSAPGMVAFIAGQLEGSDLASPIIAPPAGFKA